MARALPAVSAVLVVALGIALWAPWRSEKPVDRPLVRLDVDLGADAAFPSVNNAHQHRDLARWHAAGVSSRQSIVHPPPGSTDSHRASGTQGAAQPFFSPDGQWVGFAVRNKVNKISVDGGAVVPVELDGFLGGAPGWRPAGSIFVGTCNAGTGLASVFADGGRSTTLLAPNAARWEIDHFWPEVLPGGRTLVFTILVSTGGLDASHLALVDLESGRQSALSLRGTQARFVAANHLVYVASHAFQAVAFDVGTRKVLGTAVAVLTPVSILASGGMLLAVSANGTLVYLRGAERHRALHAGLGGSRRQETPIAGVVPGAYRFPDCRRTARVLSSRTASEMGICGC